MKYLFVVAMLSGGLLCALSLAQSTSTPANSGASQPQQTPSTTPQSQTVPSTPQTQQPTQPSMTPPNTPQNSGASQTAPAQGASASAAPVHRVAPGSVIPVQLAKSVDAKKAKTGDEVVATVTQDMKSGNGDVIIPKDTQVIGHVTESQARSKDQKESELGIAFDHAVVKGDQMQMPMSIQAVIGPQTNNPNNQASNDQSSPAMPSGGGASAASSAPSSPMGGHSGSQAPTPAQPAPNAADAGTSDSNQPQQQAKARPPINSTTEGVIGLSNLKLESNAQNATQGSLLTSEKNNVKIDKGTMMLLRVNQ
jgi:hypothetical protein